MLLFKNSKAISIFFLHEYTEKNVKKKKVKDNFTNLTSWRADVSEYVFTLENSYGYRGQIIKWMPSVKQGGHPQKNITQLFLKKKKKTSAHHIVELWSFLVFYMV